MIAALVLAAAGAAMPLPDVVVDDDGCRWLKKTSPAVLTPKPRPFVVQFPAGPPRPKPAKRRTLIPKPQAAVADYDAIGCDEGGPPAPTAALPPDEPPAEFTPAPPEFFLGPPEEPPEPILPSPEYPEPPGATRTPPYLGGAPPVYVAPPAVPLSPVPESSTLALLALALPLISGRLYYLRRRPKK